ncbi:MAG: C1 family peptidase [Clostridiales bacterium]|jgi:bleomycin hydrolase|nr:C1 family peptidase [Clostridiales bacterium]
MEQALSYDTISTFAQRFESDPASKMRMNAVVKSGIAAVAANWESKRRMRYDFSLEVETGKITNQESSGRCWMFAALNMLRVEIMKKCGLETFELSQNYIMFWDKLEKANHFLENILETLDEPLNGRLLHFLLREPMSDGGQWDMFANLVKKYGVVPKAWMPETFQSSATHKMNHMLILKLRIQAAALREAYEAGRPAEALRALKEDALYEIYQILCESLGVPPSEIIFEYRVEPKKKDEKQPEVNPGAVKSKFFRDGPITPREFYEKYIGLNLDEYIGLINAPTRDKPYNRTFTVQYLGNVREGAIVKYLNVESEAMKKAAIDQLQDGLPVWFGCDVGQMLTEGGAMDFDAYDYTAALGPDFTFDKAHRLDYGDSLMTHAMIFAGVNLDDQGRPLRWKVENSWGDKKGSEGWYIMDDKWFDLFNYQVVINKRYLDAETLENWRLEPIILMPWDPMGSLAYMR